MYRIPIFFFCLLLISCLEKNPNEGTYAHEAIEDRHVPASNNDIMAVVDTVIFAHSYFKCEKHQLGGYDLYEFN